MGRELRAYDRTAKRLVVGSLVVINLGMILIVGRSFLFDSKESPVIPPQVPLVEEPSPWYVDESDERVVPTPGRSSRGEGGGSDSDEPELPKGVMLSESQRAEAMKQAEERLLRSYCPPGLDLGLSDEDATATARAFTKGKFDHLRTFVYRKQGPPPGAGSVFVRFISASAYKGPGSTFDLEVEVDPKTRQIKSFKEGTDE